MLIIKLAIVNNRRMDFYSKFQGHEAAAVQIQEQRVCCGILVHVVERARISGRNSACRGWFDVGCCRSTYYHRLCGLSLLQSEESQIRHYGVKAFRGTLPKAMQHLENDQSFLRDALLCGRVIVAVVDDVIRYCLGPPWYNNSSMRTFLPESGVTFVRNFYPDSTPTSTFYPCSLNLCKSLFASNCPIQS